ncbi:MAG: GH146 / GH127 [uncultured Cytophagales bacterium]|uniref:GH146 / GH127 n=1 Tax=uncultured Cytophagales bacterium TaxID=158755 RepID=A0A6J4JTA8_9SPHI|nr:MAG: GH146 / GH127 [uncultured Cytophagales bacterium]
MKQHPLPIPLRSGNVRLPIFFLLWLLQAGCATQQHAPRALDYSLPKHAYKSRLQASDPAGWKPVRLKAGVPTSGISLPEKGLFSTALGRNVNYLLRSFSLDHMLAPFRVRAGIPVVPDTLPQVPFWDTQLRGSNAGRFLMGAANTLRWLPDAQLGHALNELVDEIAQCREPDGYILPYQPDSLRSEEPNYARAWLTHGLIEAGISGNQKAYALLRGHADWFNRWDTMHPKLLYWPNNSHQGHIASTRTYLSPVGKPEDLRVAEKYYVSDWWMNELSARRDSAVWQYPLQNPHSYLITSFEAYLDHYLATGDKTYLHASLGAWELIHDKWQHQGGSIAICENHWKVDPHGKRSLVNWDPANHTSHPPRSYYLTNRGHTGETCGSTFWIKFNQRLHLLYPDQEKYVAEIEKSIYNVILAAQTDEGRIHYHANLEGARGTAGIANTCCEGQGTRALGSLPEYIYTLASDGLYVNLYEPSAIDWKVKGQPVHLQLEGGFPFTPGIDIKVTTASPLDMKLRIRTPSWATGEMDILVNGRKSATGRPGTYVSLSRKWQNGDRVRFTLPMGLKATAYAGFDTIPYCNRYALEFGPILLALTGAKEAPHLIAAPADLTGELIADPAKPLHFSVAKHADYQFVPYWQLNSGQHFTVFPIVKTDSRSGPENPVRFPAGFTASFYNNTEFKGAPVYQGNAAQIDFNSGSPGEMGRIAAGVPGTHFSSRFEGEFTSPMDGAVVFFIIADDWHRFSVNDQLLSESEYLAGNRVIRSIQVEKGKKYSVKLEHKQTKGNYRIHLDGMFIGK